MDKKIIGLLVVGCLIFFSLGLLTGLFLFQGSDSDNEELALCKTRLEEVYPSIPEEIHSIFGEIIEKQENFLLVKGQIATSQFPVDGEIQAETIEVKVNLTDETKIFSIEMVKRPNELGPDESPADLFKETILTVNDLEVGKMVNASAGRNIKGEKEFTAVQVEYIQ